MISSPERLAHIGGSEAAGSHDDTIINIQARPASLRIHRADQPPFSCGNCWTFGAGKLLHCGKYAVEREGHHPEGKQTPLGLVSATMSEAAALHGCEKLWHRIGVNKDFTCGDKAIYVFKIVCTIFFFIFFLIGTIAGSIWDLPDSVWINWWAFFTVITLVVGGPSVIWLLIRGFIDLKDLTHTLRTTRCDAHNNGWVD